jgi:EmrB/QacA subfamily drug resistance transporter
MRSSAEPAGRRVFIPIALAAFITSLDSTVVTTAGPSIMRDLRLTLSGLEWVATSYVLVFASLLLAGGRLTDLIGRRTVLLLGMGSFGAASVLVALAPGMGLLLTGRALQGAGAALVVPAVLAVLAADVSGRDRHLGAGVYTIAIGASLALGPAVGGAISEHLHWTFIFWLNVPVVLVAWAATVWAIPNSTPSTPIGSLQEFVARLDLPGLLLSTLSLAAVTFALIEGQHLGYTSAPVLAAVALALLAGLLAVAWGWRSRYPLIQLDLLRNRVVLGGTGVQILWGLGLNGVFFFTAIFLQEAMDFSPTDAGLAFVPLAAALVIAVPFSAGLASRWGSHRTVCAGLVLVAGGLFAITFAGPGDSLWALMPGLVLVGVGSALTTPLTSAVLEMVPASRAGMVSAVVSVSREISGVLGIAVTGAVLALRQTAEQAAGAPSDVAFLAGYRTGLYAGAVLALVGGAIALATLRPGQAMLADDLGPAQPEPVEASPPIYLPPVAARSEADELVLDVRHASMFLDVRLSDELAWPDEAVPGSRG